MNELLRAILLQASFHWITQIYGYPIIADHLT